MDFGVEVGIFLAYTAGLMIIYFFGRLFLVPIKIILKLLLNSVIGGVVLLLINLIGSGFGVSLPVNLITALVVGILGIPGTIGLLLYFHFMGPM